MGKISQNKRRKKSSIAERTGSFASCNNSIPYVKTIMFAIAQMNLDDDQKKNTFDIFVSDNLAFIDLNGNPCI